VFLAFTKTPLDVRVHASSTKRFTVQRRAILHFDAHVHSPFRERAFWVIRFAPLPLSRHENPLAGKDVTMEILCESSAKRHPLQSQAVYWLTMDGCELISNERANSRDWTRLGHNPTRPLLPPAIATSCEFLASCQTFSSVIHFRPLARFGQ
jgi:hypothetical protein